MTTETPREPTGLTPEDERHIAEAQAAMVELMKRIPRAPAYADEPALIFLPEGRR